jgi:hypothetical protein
MTNEERCELWAEFLKSWPPERVHRITLEEYTDCIASGKTGPTAVRETGDFLESE